MGFVVLCESCRKRLSIPPGLFEKKVRGRVVTITCRACGASIRIDATLPPIGDPEAAEPVAPSDVEAASSPPIPRPALLPADEEPEHVPVTSALPPSLIPPMSQRSLTPAPGQKRSFTAPPGARRSLTPPLPGLARNSSVPPPSRQTTSPPPATQRRTPSQPAPTEAVDAGWDEVAPESRAAAASPLEDLVNNGFQPDRLEALAHGSNGASAGEPAPSSSRIGMGSASASATVTDAAPRDAPRSSRRGFRFASASFAPASRNAAESSQHEAAQAEADPWIVPDAESAPASSRIVSTGDADSQPIQLDDMAPIDDAPDRLPGRSPPPLPPDALLDSVVTTDPPLRSEPPPFVGFEPAPKSRPEAGFQPFAAPLSALREGAGIADEAAMRTPIGSIGRYTLFEKFATGGMATVHFGRLDGAGGFSRVVALKRLLPNLVQNREFVEMLLKEARLAGRVRHLNVVPTLDVVAARGDVLLVLEYVHGESLSALCRSQAERRERIPVPIATSVTLGLLRGLHAVHEATDERGKLLGLVHRDVSPANVLVGADGVARVLDFGIVKALELVEETVPNRLKGKTGYMSPEQTRGERVTRRSDVFSAGIVLWELLTLRRFAAAKSDKERMDRILSGLYEAPSIVRPEIGEDLDRVVMRALAFDPNERYESAKEFAEALESVASSASAGAVANWVGKLASEALAQRARALAIVESWTPNAYDRELGSSPFAAEVSMLANPEPTRSRVLDPAATARPFETTFAQWEKGSGPTSQLGLILLGLFALFLVVMYVALR